MSKPSLTPQQHLFIDQLSALLMPWGMSAGVARLYAYLLLQVEPVTLDCICDDLEVSKSTACVSALNLENARMIRRHSVRGSKRVLYSAVEDISAKMTEHAAMLGQFAALLQQSDLVDSERAQQQMHHYGEFCLHMQRAISDAIAAWRAIPTATTSNESS